MLSSALRAPATRATSVLWITFHASAANRSSCVKFRLYITRGARSWGRLDRTLLEDQPVRGVLEGRGDEPSHDPGPVKSIGPRAAPDIPNKRSQYHERPEQNEPRIDVGGLEAPVA